MHENQNNLNNATATTTIKTEEKRERNPGEGQIIYKRFIITFRLHVLFFYIIWTEVSTNEFAYSTLSVVFCVSANAHSKAVLGETR